MEDSSYSNAANSERNINVKLIMMKKFVLSLFVFCVASNITYADGAPIDDALAGTIVSNFLDHLGGAASNHLVDEVEPVYWEGNQVGYLATLSPSGYILVSSDTIRVPVKAYSLLSTFDLLPAAYTEVLLQELSLPATIANLARGATSADDTVNASFWEYLSTSQSVMTRSAYVPDTYLLTTKWNQFFPYNSLNPYVGEDQTLTGCTQTAVAQVMKYHQHPSSGNGVYNHSWSGQSLTAVMNRPFNWSLLSDTPHTSSNRAEQEEIGSLMLDLGILNNAYFGVDGTSAGFHYWEFEQAFGYAPISSMSNSHEDFFTTITSEIDALRPVLLSIPGHMTVADGYASDGTGRKIHVNMGWGGYEDDYYYLDQTIVAGSYSFEPNHTIYYNIKPCSGDECQTPSPPLGNNQLPEFLYQPDNHVINGSDVIRLDARDPDDDTVTLSAYSSCSQDILPIVGNLLSVDSAGIDSYCEYTVFADSHDGAAATTFKVMTTSGDAFKGESFTLNGQFTASSVDTFTVFLSGETNISGYRGYSNQAFYIWIEDQNGATIIAPSDDPITFNFSPGYYTLHTSLYYYGYNEDYSQYRISVDVEATIDEIAMFDGLSLTDCSMSVDSSGSGAGNITSIPDVVDCGADCSASIICGSHIRLTAKAESGSVFTGWSGDCNGTGQVLHHRIQEANACTATFEVDEDMDNMPDSWETLYGLDTTRDDSGEDIDNDGISNLAEYQNGTPPIVLPGDINGDDEITLADTILVLKTFSGLQTTGMKTDADVNDDGKIGLEEAIYSLRKVAGI